MNWVLKDGIKVIMQKKMARANVVYSSNEEKLREWDMKPGSINCSSVIQGLIFYAEELESVGLTLEIFIENNMIGIFKEN